MTPTTSTGSSTESVRGVWQRLFEEDPLGDEANADRDTLVFWTQAPQSGIYIDIRLPKGSLGRQDRRAGATTHIPKLPSALQARSATAGSLEDDLKEFLSDADRSILFRQKSFAGTLQFSLGDTTESGDALAKDTVLAKLAKEAAAGASKGALPLCTCFWKREMDYQPPSGGLDIGVCASAPPNNPDGSIDLRETGDDASYAEGWHRLVGSAEEHQGPFFACQLLTEDGIPRTGYWVRTGKYFAYAIGRPRDANTAESLGCAPQCAHIQGCVGKSLEEAISEIVLTKPDGVDSSLALVGTYVCVFGEVVTPSSTEEGATTWKIWHSTDPRLVGCDLLGSGPDSCTSSLSHENTVGGTSTPNILQEGDVLCQTLALGGCTRRWQVMEMDDATALMKDLPGILLS